MEWIALAIVVSVVLLLVDKNQKWKAFSRTIVWSSVTLVLLVTAFAIWQDHRDQKALADSIRNAQQSVKWDK